VDKLGNLLTTAKKDKTIRNSR